jgi:glucans biosynthesis protein C
MKNLADTSNRRYYLDWIRVLAMMGIFFFHNARFFDIFSDWHVRNATTNLAASGLVAFLSQWIMPLFFLVAGAGTYYALKTRNTGQYIQERTLRLLVPLIFGMLVIVVPQAYYEAVSHGEQLAGYNIFQIYGLYLQTLTDMNWFHLWFLVDLFLFSIITIPLFLTWGKSGKSIISRLAAFFEKPWALWVLLVLSITIVNISIYPDGYWGSRNGGWNIVTYLLFFVFGYLIFSNPRTMETIKKVRWFALGTGIIASSVLFTLYLNEMADLTNYFGSSSFVIGSLIQALNAWGWLLTILGFGSRYLNRNNRFLAYSNEAVLPFYILHQTVIIVIGFFVVQWASGAGIKYLTISTTSFIVIMIIYELMVRRFNTSRFLFGMKSRKRAMPVLTPGDQTHTSAGVYEDRQ